MAPAGASIDLETGEILEEPGERPTVRIAIGAALLVVADVGILHLAYGRPAIDGPVADLRGAGGFSAPRSPGRSRRPPESPAPR